MSCRPPSRHRLTQIKLQILFLNYISFVCRTVDPFSRLICRISSICSVARAIAFTQAMPLTCKSVLRNIAVDEVQNSPRLSHRNVCCARSNFPIIDRLSAWKPASKNSSVRKKNSSLLVTKRLNRNCSQASAKL